MNIMKDLPQYNKTPEEGWSGMNVLLDKAMPVTKNRRYVPFIWMAASVLVLAGAISLFVMQTDKTPDQTDTIATEEENQNASYAVTNHDHNVETSDHEVLTKETENVTTNSISAQNEELSQGLISGTETDFTPAQSDEEVTYTKQLKNQTEGTIAIHQKTTNEEALSLSIEAELLNPELNTKQTAATEVSDDAETAPLTLRPVQIPIVSSLPVIVEPLSTDVGQRPVAEIHDLERKRKRVPSLFSPTLQTAAIFGQYGGLGGYGGIGVDWNISRKFSLTTAIGYSAYMPDAGFRSLKDASLGSNELISIINYDPTGADDYVFSESINPAADYRAITPLVETVSQWQIDVGLNWRFSRRFFASGGVIFGFNADAISQYPIVSGNSTTTPSSPRITLGNSLADYNVIRKSSTSMYFGFGYRLSPHFDLTAQWMHSFNEYVLNTKNDYLADLSTGDRTDYIRGLRLGIRYSL